MDPVMLFLGESGVVYTIEQDNGSWEFVIGIPSAPTQCIMSLIDFYLYLQP